MPFEKLPAVKGSTACLTCGCGARSDLSPENVIAVGFGTAGYQKDGKTIWEETPDVIDNPDSVPTVADVEAQAKLDPDHDWRIFFFAPLYEAEYQRQGDDCWVLVRRGEGFA